MRIRFTPRLIKLLATAPARVQEAFYKKVALLEQNLRHPSLHAKKYDEGENVWQARVNRDWRFYFGINGDEYVIYLIQKHPK